MMERKLSDFSEIDYRIFTQEINERHRAIALIIQFSGFYRHGSQGTGDGELMRVVTRMALTAWEANAVVFDLRDLDYRWGDNIFGIYRQGRSGSGIEDRPRVTIISTKCASGFESSIAIGEPIFDSLDEGIDNVRTRTQQYLDDLKAPFESSG